MSEPMDASRRGFVGSALSAGVAGLAVSACAMPRVVAEGETQRPAFLLVHGAWHGGWCWSLVAAPLRAAGHAVHSPTQTGLGERSHLMSRSISMDTLVQDLVNVIDFEELNDVIVVGHSFGGRSAAGLVDRMPTRVRRLVLLDCSIPNPKPFLDLLPDEARRQRLKAAEDSSGGLSVAVPSASYFGLTRPEDVQWVSRRLTPQPLSTYVTPLMLNNPVGNGRPVTFIRCTVPGFESAAAAATYARSRSDWQYLELPTAHDAMVSEPVLLSKMLMSLR